MCKYTNKKKFYTRDLAVKKIEARMQHCFKFAVFEIDFARNTTIYILPYNGIFEKKIAGLHCLKYCYKITVRGRQQKLQLYPVKKKKFLIILCNP